MTTYPCVGRLLVAMSIVSCSGSSSAPAGPGDAGPPPSSTTPAEIPRTDNVDAGSPPLADDAGDDAGVPPPSLTVREKRPPECHDLTQYGPLVVPTTSPDAVPVGMPLATPPSGLYVVTRIIQYESTGASSQPESRTTVFVTPTRWYYLRDGSPATTTSWSLEAGALRRVILCRETGIGSETVNSIFSAPYGFIVMGRTANNRPLAFYYEAWTP